MTPRMKAFLSFFVTLPLGGAFAPVTIVPRPSAKDPVPVYEQRVRTKFSERTLYQPQFMAATSDEDQAACWRPQLRKTVTGVASIGVLETAYLTYIKLTSGADVLCGTDGGCSTVLTGPYSTIPFTDIPLAAAGLAAYSLVALLAFLPLISSLSKSGETENRIWLTAATTAMGTFSVFLMSLLLFVLHETCPYCILSACLSIGMAGIVWSGGALPDEDRKRGMVASAGTFVMTVVASLVLFFTGEISTFETQFAGSSGGSSDSRLLASSEGLKPPPITTQSSERAIALSNELAALDARMYGAYWCSHCYDQKQAFGKEAYAKIPYVECSKDGYNPEISLCKKKNVPGYPTWEVAGKLYPGEQALEELEEIVQNAKKSN